MKTAAHAHSPVFNNVKNKLWVAGLGVTPAFAGSSLLAGVLGNGTLKNVGAEVLP